jgi:excisionase family DNA binding protein
VTSDRQKTHDATRGAAKATFFFTIGNIANFLDVCPRTVRRWIKSKLLITHRINGLVRISEADFEAFLAARRDD